MKPIFKVNGHDYTKYLAEDGLKPSRNDLDADGSGRNLLDGLMVRSRITSKKKWTVTFILMGESIASQLLNDMWPQYVSITMLDAKENRYIEREYYCSTINEGIQRYIGGQTMYDGITFNITER
uniref:Uncharacterized protein n=1 Tax=Siphoviridae sp. ct0uL16 TaxID=2825299 RepID=A0A8S5Q637_9CAUD|nr:MAG TPA: hypothetical protein [Siphoviridae sp. ct0uL16]